MPTISNKTKRPLRVRLPGGKTLHLGPGKSGQITPAAADYPAVKELVEAGELDLALDDRGPASKPADGGSTRISSQNTNATGGIRHTGDR